MVSLHLVHHSVDLIQVLLLVSVPFIEHQSRNQRVGFLSLDLTSSWDIDPSFGKFRL